MEFIPPVKIVFSGNKAACTEHIKFAKNQLMILERLMSFQGLTQGRRVVNPYQGVYVECLSNFSQKEVRILVDHQSEVVKGSTAIHAKPVMVYPEEVFLSGLYFVRIKYQDPDIEPYENWDSYISSDLSSDRIMLWELEFVDGVLKAGKAKLILDADVEKKIVYFPLNGDDEGNLAKANKYLIKCPSNNVPNPPNSLKDLASEWLISGGLSDPENSSDTCGEPNVNKDIFYNINDTYTSPLASKDYCAFIPKAPIAIDIKFLSTWKTDWCSDPLIKYRQTWNGLEKASSIVGQLATSGGRVTNSQESWRLDKSVHSGTSNGHAISFGQTWEVDSQGELILKYPPGYPTLWSPNIFITVKKNNEGFSPEASKRLSRGTWFNGKPGNTFNCFFLYEYLAGQDVDGIFQQYNYIAEGESEDAATLMSDNPSFVYTQFNLTSTGGLVTPLEIIEAPEYISSLYDSLSCSEFPCPFSLSTGQFSWLFGSPDHDYLVHFFGEDHYDYFGCSASAGSAIRNVTDICKRSRERFHIVETKVKKDAINLVSLSHYREAKGLQSAGATVSTYDQLYKCNGVDEFMESTFAQFGYVAYIFSPKELYQVDPTTQKVTYWDIYSERGNSNIIHPNRYLSIEEHVNKVVLSMQTVLDIKAKLPPEQFPQIVHGCAYPLNFYGYGITDGFIEEIP